MLTHQTDVAPQMQALMGGQFQQRPGIAALVAAFGKQYQDLEDALWSIYTGRPYPAAVGDALSRWGSTVGAPRPVTGAAATDDTQYRGITGARIIENSASGATEQVFSLLRSLGASNVLIEEPGNAHLILTYQGTLPVDDTATKAFLVATTPPVSLTLQEMTAHPFGFDDFSFGLDDGELGRTL